MDVIDLLEESFKDENIVTIEATVVTGFEYLALDECKVKCEPKNMVKSRGRIFFNVLVDDYEKVISLRSVDNLYLIGGATTKLDLLRDKEQDLEIVKNLVDKVNWDKTIKSWQKMVGFRGNIFEQEEKNKTDVKTEDQDIAGNIEVVTEEEGEIKDADLVLEKSNTGLERNGMLNYEGELEKNEGIRADESGDKKEIVKEDSNMTGEKISLEVKEIVNEEEELKDGGEHKLTKIENKKRKGTGKNRNQKIRGSKDLKGVEGQMIKFRVTCHRTGKHSFTSMEAARDFGGNLQDKFNWTVDLSHYDLEVMLMIASGSSYIGVRLTHGSLHRRNIIHFGGTTLRATLCYCLLSMASPKVGEVVIDPLCGGGSISIEGKSAFPFCYHICGDKDKKALSRSRGNVESLDPKQRPEVVGWDATKLPLKSASVDVAAIDLPFGKRSGMKIENERLYIKVLLELARVVTPNTGRISLLTSDKHSFMMASYATGKFWKMVRSHAVNQGGLLAYVFLLQRSDIKEE